jgi:hypothetical protein
MIFNLLPANTRQAVSTSIPGLAIRIDSVIFVQSWINDNQKIMTPLGGREYKKLLTEIATCAIIRYR